MMFLRPFHRPVASLVVLLAAALSNTLAQTAGQAPPPLGRLVDVGGYRVHLYCVGEGTPTVVIAGAGASFDWGLVQADIAKRTRVCAYDHSGTVWSDAGPGDSCSLRVNELHAALKSAEIRGPLVLVGHSLGALVQADRSSHYIMIDRPDLVVRSIARVIDAVRAKARLAP